MTRSEHIEWCKIRALAYLKPGPFHSLRDAGASLVADLQKHPDTVGHPAVLRCFSLLASGADEAQLRAFIEGIE